MCYFSIPFYFSYSNVPYSDSIYPVPKIFTASSGEIRRLTKYISYIIAYYSQASQCYIGIINHGSNCLFLHGIYDWQTPLRSSKNYFIFKFLKYFNRYFDIATLFSSFPPDKRRRISSNQALYVEALGKYFWLSESGIATRSPYFEFVWTYFSVFLVQ